MIEFNPSTKIISETAKGKKRKIGHSKRCSFQGDDNNNENSISNNYKKRNEKKTSSPSTMYSNLHTDYNCLHSTIAFFKNQKYGNRMIRKNSNSILYHKDVHYHNVDGDDDDDANDDAQYQKQQQQQQQHDVQISLKNDLQITKDVYNIFSSFNNEFEDKSNLNQYILRKYQSKFKLWCWYLIASKHNLLLYGIGCKKLIINNFIKKYLLNEDVIEFNSNIPVIIKHEHHHNEYSNHLRHQSYGIKILFKNIYKSISINKNNYHDTDDICNGLNTTAALGSHAKHLTGKYLLYNILI